MLAKHAHHAHFKLDNVQRILRYNVIMLQAASVTPTIWAPRPHGSKHMLNQHYTVYLTCSNRPKKSTHILSAYAAESPRAASRYAPNVPRHITGWHTGNFRVCMTATLLPCKSTGHRSVLGRSCSSPKWPADRGKLVRQTLAVHARYLNCGPRRDSCEGKALLFRQQSHKCNQP